MSHTRAEVFERTLTDCLDAASAHLAEFTPSKNPNLNALACAIDSLGGAIEEIVDEINRHNGIDVPSLPDDAPLRFGNISRKILTDRVRESLLIERD